MSRLLLDELNLHDGDLRDLRVDGDEVIFSCAHWATSIPGTGDGKRQVFVPVVLHFRGVHDLEFWIPLPEAERTYRIVEPIEIEEDDLLASILGDLNVLEIRELVGPTTTDVDLKTFLAHVRAAQVRAFVPMGVSSTKIDEDGAFVAYFHDGSGFAVPFGEVEIRTDDGPTTVGQGEIFLHDPK